MQMPRSAASDLGLHCLSMSKNGMLGLYGLIVQNCSQKHAEIWKKHNFGQFQAFSNILFKN